MEFYCNSNFYGNRCYGVETASKFYFGCSAKDVTLGQAAISRKNSLIRQKMKK